jgi:hypothetical protein
VSARKAAILGLAVSLGVLTPLLSAIAVTAAASSQTFHCTGGVATYQVPTGVTVITVQAVGAAGGGSSIDSPTVGGLGALVQGDFNVAAGAVLSVLVGCHGVTTGLATAGGGGGASAVWSGISPIAPTSALLIAGGGGGGSRGSCGENGLDASSSSTAVWGEGPEGGTGGTYPPGSGGAGGAVSADANSGSGGGGAGLVSNGGDGTGPGDGGGGGVALDAGAAGGVGGASGIAGAGGFGGGGGAGSNDGGGGGGGVTGGGGGGGDLDQAPECSAGGGGGSLNNGTNAADSTHVDTIDGNGVVMIVTHTTSRWQIVPSPNVKGATQTRLNAISCASASQCSAVGGTVQASGEPPLIEGLSGGKWKLVASPSPFSATLNDVSCAAATACIAVGSDSPPTGEATFVMRLAGGKWKVMPSPNPASDPFSALQAVSCTTSTVCTAVGLSQTPSPATFVTLVEVLSGGKWTVVPSPNAPGEPSSNLNSIACISSADCIAVGQSDGPSGDSSLVEQLSGGVWSVVNAPDIGRLNSVSCSSASTCVAVGNAGIEQFAGGIWSVMPNPAVGALVSVSCQPTMICVAAGASANSTVVERMTGSVWTVVPTPNVQGVPTSVLDGVACRSMVCYAVGFSQAASSDVSTLIEQT